MAKSGQPWCDGPASKAPWWWSTIAYHERRLESIAELAALDEDQELPPKQFWYSGAHSDLQGWIDERKKRREDR